MRRISAIGRASGMVVLSAAVLAVHVVSASGAHAQGAVLASPLGVWIDHTGRGAVEITECGKGVCGHVVWIKDAKNSQGCGVKILSDVKPVGGNKWDNGKIFDPDQNSTYDVELTPIGADKLKVMGYAGVKFLSQTFTWKRANGDLKRCNDQGNANSTAASQPTQKAEVPKAAEPAAPEPTNGASMSAGTGSNETKAPEKAQAKEDPVVPAVRDPQVAAAPPQDSTQKAAEPEEEDSKPEPRRKGGKKQCKFRVPFGDMVVYYPCEK